MTTRETELVRTLSLLANRASDVRDHVEEWSEEAVRAVVKQPLRTLSLAIGAGFVLGGGLLSRLAFRALGTGIGVGVRVAALPLITAALLGSRGQHDALNVGPAASDTKDRGSRASIGRDTPRRQTHENE